MELGRSLGLCCRLSEAIMAIRQQLIVGILVATVVALGDGTNSARAADKWISVRSQNFLLVGNAGDARIRRVARDLEEFRAAFATLFPGTGKQSSVGTTVIVFKDDGSFKPYKPLYEGKPANISGYFQPGRDMNFIALDSDLDSPKVIYHEFVHQLTRDTTQRLPTWVSEGLAEFYSTFEANGRTMSLGRAISSHIQTLRDKPLIPLETFLTVDEKSPLYNEQSKQGIFYAESWALVHYLIAGNNSGRKPQFSRYLGLLAEGKPLEQSFQEAFQTDYAGIERELRSYMQAQLAWPYFKVQLPEKLDFDKALESSPLTEAQSEYYLGDMLLHIRRYDAAEKELQKAITLDPNFGGSYAAIGMLRLQQDKDEEALQFLSKAVQTDTQNPLAHYYYAELLQRLASKDDSNRKERLQLMRTHLKKSIELAPDFIEAYRWLGYVALSLQEELSETETALGQALKSSPGNEDLRLTLAEIMANNKKEAAARVLVTNVRNAATNEAIRSRATSLLERINARIESEAAMRDYEERRKAAGLPSLAADDASPRISRSPNASATTTPDSTVTVASLPNQSKGPQIEGYLTMIDCTNGMNLHVRVGNGSVQLHTNTPSQIDFVSYVTSVKGEIGCGPVKPELHVIITYKRSADPAFLGEPLIVEFRQ
jgi:tetratricopeptide (TPR) repeat protein